MAIREPLQVRPCTPEQMETIHATREADPLGTAIEDADFWHAHYDGDDD